jgi:hypothetical protein
MFIPAHITHEAVEIDAREAALSRAAKCLPAIFVGDRVRWALLHQHILGELHRLAMPHHHTAPERPVCVRSSSVVCASHRPPRSALSGCLHLAVANRVHTCLKRRLSSPNCPPERTELRRLWVVFDWSSNAKRQLPPVSSFVRSAGWARGRGLLFFPFSL